MGQCTDKGVKVRVFNLRCTSVPEDCFYLRNNVDSNGCFNLIIFFMSYECLCSVSLSHGGMDLSVISDCDKFRFY